MSDHAVEHHSYLRSAQMSRATALLDESHRLLLRAISRPDHEAIVAFTSWRSKIDLDDIDQSTRRIMPILVDLADRSGLKDADISRMRGIRRHTWTSNVLQLRQLFIALDALEKAGIPSLVMKSAALFARSPRAASRRMAGDYDILIAPGAFGGAKRALEEVGFSPKGFDWQDFEGDLAQQTMSGAPISIRNQHGEIDLHWRPLINIGDPRLVDQFFVRAETASLQGRAVRVPRLSDHFFMAMARCEPSDQVECFNRLVEAYFLLSDSVRGIRWDEVEYLVRRYGMEVPALSFLSALMTETATLIPHGLTSSLLRRRSWLKEKEWRIRSVGPRRRTPVQRWLLARFDRMHRRVEPHVAHAGLLEALLWQYHKSTPRLALLWHLASRRFRGPSTGRPRFLAGFSFPETDGRWTEGQVAFMALPLTPEQRRGGKTNVAATVFRGQRPKVAVYAAGGAEVFHKVLANDEADPGIALTVRPQARLGGDGLILFWLPDAMSPKEAGESEDRRLLGLFLRQN